VGSVVKAAKGNSEGREKARRHSHTFKISVRGRVAVTLAGLILGLTSLYSRKELDSGGGLGGGGWVFWCGWGGFWFFGWVGGVVNKLLKTIMIGSQKLAQKYMSSKKKMRFEEVY